MIGKLGVAAAVAMAGVWVSGALGGGYAREVARPQAEVMHALEDLDITQAPGAPGTDPSRSGGVRPVFRLSRTPGAMIWTVMSGDKVATRLIADFTAVDATHTKVTARVERGDAPDDLVSPAFRSRGVTLGLFGMVLEDELNALTKPPENVAGCAQLIQRMEDGEYAPTRSAAADGSLSSAMDQTAKTVIALNAVEGERRRLGCRDPNAGEFRSVRQAMRPADDLPIEAMRSDGVVIEPGKPMVDPSAAASGRRD